MTSAKLIDRKNALNSAIAALTLSTFVRAGGLANLLAVTVVFITMLAVALVNYDRRFVLAGLWLFPYVTLVVWGSAAALLVGALTLRWLLLVGQRMTRTSRSTPSDRSGVWDDWLDCAEPHSP